ncbi:MAG: hypothetical protein CM15mP86_17900 [Gammaproteobacteria bacterium]|nr:MAG: hypothetical protein CM15mP86_17900 [Gammaproteobacteria bacterium]
MNSADALLKTLIANGLEVVFANPGTSEMHLVAAIDHHPEIRPYLVYSKGLLREQPMVMQESLEKRQRTYCI